ncbi:phage antirepressor [Pseudoclavibacter helvolus]|uniref:phage antirepressor n=1 Tax=Pseudoclavibacter helvolus TaxID=255205 RepID=UPI003C76130B
MPNPIDQQTTALDLFNYKGIEIRTALIDDAIWFVAADVARVLGYREAYDLTRNLDDDEKGPQNVRTPGGEQTLTVISEAGLYSAIIRSRIESAKPFRRWITHEVIPAIRKTGSYGIAELTGPELMARALLEAASTIEARDNRIAELEPAATSWDKLASASGDYSARDAAQVLSRGGVQIGQNRLFKWLRENKWIDATSRPYQRFVDQGLISERIRSFRIVRTNGEEQLAPPQVRITAKGIDAIRRALAPATAQIEA